MYTWLRMRHLAVDIWTSPSSSHNARQGTSCSSDYMSLCISTISLVIVMWFHITRIPFQQILNSLSCLNTITRHFCSRQPIYIPPLTPPSKRMPAGADDDLYSPLVITYNHVSVWSASSSRSPFLPWNVSWFLNKRNEHNKWLPPFADSLPFNLAYKLLPVRKPFSFYGFNPF